MLDFVKMQVLGIVPPGYWSDLVEKHWNEFANYAIMTPVLWYHYTRLLAGSYFDQYNILVKLFYLIYLGLVFTTHELLRLVVVKLVTKQMTPAELMAKAIEVYNYLKVKVIAKEAQLEEFLQQTTADLKKKVQDMQESSGTQPSG